MPSFNVDASFVSAVAAAISAVFAGLAFLFSRRPSRRDMIDILKIEILQIVSSVKSRKRWIETIGRSMYLEGAGLGPRAGSLAACLGPKYQKRKWVVLIPVALEELKREEYGELLGTENWEEDWDILL